MRSRFIFQSLLIPALSFTAIPCLANPCLDGLAPPALFPPTDNLVFDERGQGLVTKLVPLTPEATLEAYSKGIFPWVDYGETAGWFVLKDRGILDFSTLHIPASLKRELKKSKFQVTFDQAFEDVMRGCATVSRPGDEGTWIADKFVTTYTELHRQGHAHSVEVWQDGALVGGLYGIHVNGVFSGESMFHKVSGASKHALIAMIEHLKARGIQWMDTQQVSALPAQLGGRTIPHSEYLERLRAAQGNPISFY